MLTNYAGMWEGSKDGICEILSSVSGHNPHLVVAFNIKLFQVKSFEKNDLFLIGLLAKYVDL